MKVDSGSTNAWFSTVTAIDYGNIGSNYGTDYYTVIEYSTETAANAGVYMMWFKGSHKLFRAAHVPNIKFGPTHEQISFSKTSSTTNLHEIAFIRRPDDPTKELAVYKLTL
jgi:hypothetical protein